MLFFMQLSKKIPFDDPTVLNGVRAAYVLSNLMILGVYLYVRSKIYARKGSSGWGPYCDAGLGSFSLSSLLTRLLQIGRP